MAGIGVRRTHVVIAAALAILPGIAGCDGGEAGESGRTQTVEDERVSSGLTGIDPCVLLSKEEIAAQVALAEGWEVGSRGFEVSTEEAESELSRSCAISWRSVMDGTPWSRGDFSVMVLTAEWLKSLAELGRRHTPERLRRPITGVGDEAFFVEYAPYARVGNVAVGILEFLDTPEDPSGLALLRIAARRLH